MRAPGKGEDPPGPLEEPRLRGLCVLNETRKVTTLTGERVSLEKLTVKVLVTGDDLLIIALFDIVTAHFTDSGCLLRARCNRMCGAYNHGMQPFLNRGWRNCLAVGSKINLHQILVQRGKNFIC